jgi:mannan endo-1,4-beta-mannosidase
MKKYAITLAIIICIMSCTSREKMPEPVNPNASNEARALLKFIYEIKGQYTLSGQHNFINSGSKYMGVVQEITGKIPVVWGSDFSFCVEDENFARFQHCGPLNLSDPSDSAYVLDLSPETARAMMVDEVIKKHKEGHIITLMWHGCFPDEGDCCEGSNIWALENRPSDSTWNLLCTDGSTLNQQWKEQMDNIAFYLQTLQKENIPVLWRPWHEMNGVWFWWCNHPGEDGIKKLWIMTYDYLTNHHKLNNLLWVWNTNAPRDIPGDEAFDYELFFPGHDYVDILAADVYRNDYKQSHHDDLIKLAGNKPISLGEVGGLPGPDILQQQPSWTWFMSWGNLVTRSNSEQAIIDLYQSPHVLTLDEISKDGDGYSVSIN